MYYEDLTPYYYSLRHRNGEWDENVLNIGWLDEDHPFPKGKVPEPIQKRVLALCFLDPVNRTLGYHASPFLKPAPIGYPVEFNGRRALLGSAEIRVPGKNHKVYAAPNLIYHYIKDCGYLPAKEFLDAVESLPPVQQPSDAEYEIYSIALADFCPLGKRESIVFLDETKCACLVPAERDTAYIHADEPWTDAELAGQTFIGGIRRRRVLTGGDPEKTLRATLPRIAGETIDNFVEKNRTPAMLEPRLKTETPQEALRKEHERLYWSKSSMEDGWILFEAAFPRATAYFYFSRVGFNNQQTEALLEIGVWHKSLVGRGIAMLLRKDAQGAWETESEVLIWTS